MRYSKYAALLLLLLCSFVGYSQVYTVTDRGDNGPGTLRYGLQNVPAGTTGYTIKFNLSGTATDDNRTIRLKTPLPAIPSNVTIDGSSQSWAALGVSGAKIIIEPEAPNLNFHGLTIGAYQDVYKQVSNVQIYGLFIRDFAKITSLQNVNLNQGSGIWIDYRATNIKIGAAGKGNVIGGTINGIAVNNSGYYQMPVLANISVQSNLIGVHYDGLTAIPNITGISASLYEASIGIGGDQPGEGNTIAANQTNIDVSRYYYSSNIRTSITIVNNNIGVDFSGTRDFRELQLFKSSSSLEIHGVKINSTNTDVYLRKNIISGNRTTGVTIANADFKMTSNHIGTGKAKTEVLSNGVGVKIEGSAIGEIGGVVTADLGNFIANNDYGVELLSNNQVKIMRNSFYCNKVFGIGQAQNYTQAYVQILVKKANLIEGRSSPNAEVELFYTENCNELCEGKTYIVTVQADANGKWKYDEKPITGNVSATATILNGTTSQFSTAALLEGEAIVTSVTCKGNGSIKIPEPRQGFFFTWYRVEPAGGRTVLVPKGTTQEINNLPVGEYEVVIDDGCKEMSKRFLIKDQKLTNLVVNWPSPGCGELTFNFSGTVDRGEGTITYQWIEVDKGTITNGQNVNLPEGNYKLKVTDEAGCPLESSAKLIKRLPMPIFDYSAMQVGKAACGEKNGAIKNIIVNDITGIPIYKWYVMTYNPLNGGYVRGAKVGDDLDLEGVVGGLYVLEVRDGGACSPVQSFEIPIEITNSVFISGGSVAGATCGNNNGAINGLVIMNGDTYKLTANDGSFEKNGNCDSGVSFDITGLPPGNYTLEASHSVTLCTATPRTFTVLAVPVVKYTAQLSKSDASCGNNNGSIRLNYPNNEKPLPGNYQWENAAGQPYAGTAELISDLPEGSYILKIKDPNGCIAESLGPYVIERIPLLIVDKNIGQVTDDVCGLGRGSVTGVKISGGLPLSGTGNDAVYKYAWKDVEGNTVRTTRDLVGIGAGDYYLEVTDQTTCGVDKSKTFTIAAPVIKLPTPIVNDIRVCYATEIMLPIVGAEEGQYQLYVMKEEGVFPPEDELPLLETKNGRFIFKVSKTGDYLIRRNHGTCYSDFVAVHIEVTNDNLEIKNTMTPNGDGMNDYWMITGLPDHKDINIKIYTRSGQLVYESVGPYHKPFDGRFRGAELPAGAYYYKIDLRADCKPLAGSITLLR